MGTKPEITITHEGDDDDQLPWVVRYTYEGRQHVVCCETEAEAFEYERFFLEEFEELVKNILEDLNEQHNKKGERS